MAMFKKAAENIVEVSGLKTLHPVTDLNTAERFKPLCIVEKKASFWMWKKPSMSPTFIQMKDVLSQDLDLSIEKKKFTLLKDFQEHPSLEVSGSIKANILSEASIELKADEKLNLVLKLGDIEKNEVSWQLLSDALKSNPVNREHPLYLRAKDHPHTSLCVIIGSICTEGEGSLEGENTLSNEDKLKLNKLSVISAEIETKASIEKKSAYSFTIPPSTVLAYSCVEFSISPCDGLITLHCTFDTFDDKHTSGVLKKMSDLDIEDGEDNVDVTGEEDPISIIEHELHSLIQFGNFGELQREFTLLIRSPTNNNTFQAMHTLLHLALRYMENDNVDNFVLSSSFKAFSEDDKELRWKMILTLLGFSVPEDISNEHAFIVLPGNDEHKYVIKACVGLVDAIVDLSDNVTEMLRQLPITDMRIVRTIIESQLRNRTVNLTDVTGKEASRKDTPILEFLGECGVHLSGAKQTVNFSGNDKTALLDLHIVLYVLCSH